jgi:hypothetical protein
MLEGYSLRKSTDLIGDVHFVTLFYWRHKVLSALKQMDFNAFSGIVEMDETYFLYSEKGKRNIEGHKPRKRGSSSKFRGISHEQVCVLIARDRQKATYSGVLGKGRIVKTQLDKAIVNGQYALYRCLEGFFCLCKKNIIVLNQMVQSVIIFKMSITITAV